MKRKRSAGRRARETGTIQSSFGGAVGMSRLFQSISVTSAAVSVCVCACVRVCVHVQERPLETLMVNWHY